MNEMHERTDEKKVDPVLSRRQALKNAGAAFATVTGLSMLLSRKANAASDDTNSSNILLRMQTDIERALKKPAAERRWAMAIDQQKCIGCKACTVACMSENKTPPGVAYRPVFEEMEGSFPVARRKFTPRPCMHCAKPACLEACPVEAIKRRPDGIVYIDYDACEGYKACIPACPYGVPAFDEGQYFTQGTPTIASYEKAPTYEMGIKRTRDTLDKPPVGRSRKCHYCFHRLEAGMLPSCTSTCVTHATFFGDLNDPESLVSELAQSKRVHHLKVEAGTKPTTFYLI